MKREFILYYFFTLLYYTEYSLDEHVRVDKLIIHCLGYLRNWTDYRFIVFWSSTLHFVNEVIYLRKENAFKPK